jgi:hypothetical protein
MDQNLLRDQLALHDYLDPILVYMIMMGHYEIRLMFNQAQVVSNVANVKDTIVNALVVDEARFIKFNIST